MAKGQWQERTNPPRLEKRYEFDSYDSLRDFLENAASLSEQKGLYPDVAFSRMHASFTIHAEEGSSTLGEQQREFAILLDTLLTTGQE